MKPWSWIISHFVRIHSLNRYSSKVIDHIWNSVTCFDYIYSYSSYFLFSLFLFSFLSRFVSFDLLSSFQTRRKKEEKKNRMHHVSYTNFHDLNLSHMCNHQGSTFICQARTTQKKKTESKRERKRRRNLQLYISMGDALWNELK